jgi:hypothetical protein
VAESLSCDDVVSRSQKKWKWWWWWLLLLSSSPYVIAFMQGIYIYSPETNCVSRTHGVAAIL